MNFIRKQTGVTFLELLVVVALIAVLSLFAYPSYQKYMLRLNRLEVRNTMETIAQRLEQNFSVTRDFEYYYDATNPSERAGVKKTEAEMLTALGYTLTAVGGPVADAIAVPENKPVYGINLKYIPAPDPNDKNDPNSKYGPGFYLQAQAVGRQVKDKCEFFYLNHRNVRKATRGTPDWANTKARGGLTAECWNS